jgi:hypothetical protein
MEIVSTAVILASEEAAVESGQVSPYFFGAFALVGLVALLIVTMMVKVGD